MKGANWDIHRAKLEAQIQAGRLWEARDYALSILRDFADREELRATLARVYHDMHDLPRAGVLWMTTRDDSPEALGDIECCVSEFGEKLPYSMRKPLRWVRYPEPITRRVDQTLKRAGEPKGINAISGRQHYWDQESGSWRRRRTASLPTEIGFKIIGFVGASFVCLAVLLALSGLCFWVAKLVRWIFR